MTLRDDLFAWLSAQDLWQQDLARRLVGQTELTGASYDEALLTIKGVFGALTATEVAQAPEAFELDDLPAEPAADAPRLVSFGRLRGVGAVNADQELRFLPNGLTVVYGQNAAGKTTYVRALKRVCRTVDRDPEVRGNVFTTADAAPTATVGFVHAGQQRAQQLNLADPPDLGLDAISVFDSRCAELYINRQNSVAYVPSDLLLLARMAATQDRMRRDLQAAADRLTEQAPTFREFVDPSVVKSLLDELTARTDTDELRSLATLGEHDQARLEDLDAALASSAARNVQVDADAARQDAIQARALARSLRELAERTESPAVVQLRALAVEAATAQQAVELAAREFAGLPVGGVGSAPWRQLWQAARAFSETVGAPFPPTEEGQCPLCLQQVAPEARLSRSP